MIYDVAVIGAGPGGYVAAIRAAQLGGKVLLVEKDTVGGVCLNRGCIPTKTILKCAEKWQDLKRCGEFGLTAENIKFDYQAIAQRKNKVVQDLRSGIEQLIKSNEIKLVVGFASLIDTKTISVTTPSGSEEYKVNNVILATGSMPGTIPIPGRELPGVMTSDQLLELSELPKSLLVVGAGVVGIEFSTIMNSFGSEVTVVEMLPTILPMVDGELVKRVGLNLRKQGIKTITGSSVTAIEQNGEGLSVMIDTAKGSQIISVDKVLISVGRRPVLEMLGLENVGVNFDRLGISVNERMETNVSGIYAIGDVTGQSMLAHAASAAAVVAAENAMGLNAKMDYSVIPSCIFITPEIAMVGLTEEECKNKNISVKTSKFNFAANGKAVTMGETDGMVKIISEAATGNVIGMHVFGPHASDLIMEGALAIRNGLAAKDIAHTVHPHPTLSETVMESAHGIDGDMIHQAKIKLRK